MQLLLASKSPRRQQLLNAAGYSFDVVNVDVEEDFPAHLKAEEIPMFLAEKKADGYNQDLTDKVLITADTTVWIGNTVLNKPADFDEAFDMIQSLNNTSHYVYTGVSLRTSDKQKTFYSETEVAFSQMSNEDITYYINTCKPYDKAGAYGIQEWLGYRFVKKIKGCYNNVVGFPLEHFTRELNTFINN